VSDAAAILRELVAIPSVSRMSNRPLIERAAHYLLGAGWQIEELPYRDEAGIEKVNLIARPGHAAAVPEAAIELAWFCHTDTVPIAEGWRNATRLREDGGMLHGSGACDVKGSLACFLAAITKVRSEAVLPGVALVLTADEEVGCVGAEFLLERSNLRPRRAIISEPTSLAPAVAGKGYGLARVVIRAREAHSAFPEQGVSAIRIAAQMVDAIYRELPGEAAPCNPLFTPPQTTVNVGTLVGGTAKNIVAGSCEFLVEWRPIPEEDPAQVSREIERLARRLERDWMGERARNGAGCRIAVEVLRAEAGFAPGGGVLAQSLEQLLGERPTGISFSSEASRVARVAEEVVVIGPGDMRTAHSERECVPAEQLVRWTDAIGRLLEQGLEQ
jgi:acetylornithine deacetylase